MADIKKRADLMHILPAQAARIKKMERQLAVPRTYRSIVAASETTTSASPVALTTADTVTVVTTDVCLIHIYFEVEASTTGLSATVYVRDHDAANGAGVNTAIAGTDSATPENLTSTRFPSVDASNQVPRGNFLTFTNTPKWDNATGAHTFSLRYATNTGTATFFNRKLFAWVQPF